MFFIIQIFKAFCYGCSNISMSHKSTKYKNSSKCPTSPNKHVQNIQKHKRSKNGKKNLKFGKRSRRQKIKQIYQVRDDATSILMGVHGAAAPRPWTRRGRGRGRAAAEAAVTAVAALESAFNLCLFADFRTYVRTYVHTYVRTYVRIFWSYYVGDAITQRHY